MRKFNWEGHCAKLRPKNCFRRQSQAKYLTETKEIKILQNYKNVISEFESFLTPIINI